MNIKNFLVFLTSFALAFLSAELFLRFEYNKTTSFAAPEQGWTIFDSELGWVTGPNMVGQEKEAIITINSAGARGEEFKKDPEVLAVGDSFTLGALVNDDETWPFYLSEMIESEVANFGVDAYGVDQIFLRTQRLLEKYNPQAVVMGLIEDDFYRSALDRWVTGEKRPKFVKNEAGLWEAPQKKIQEIPGEESKVFRDWHTILTDWSRLWILAPYDDISVLNKSPRFYRQGVEISIQLIKRLQEQLNKDGVDFHVLLLGGDFQRWEMKPKLESHGISVVDCSDLYHDKKHVIAGDGHPSARGHKAYAQCLKNAVNF